MRIVVHARIQDGFVELPVHLVGVSIRRRIVHLDDRDALFHPVIDQRLNLGCGSHMESPLSLSRHSPAPSGEPIIIAVRRRGCHYSMLASALRRFPSN